MRFHFSSVAAVIVAAATFLSPTSVHGHGYVTSPASRNYYATTMVAGSWNPSNEPGQPKVETTPQGVNRNNGICGFGQSGPPDYDLWLDTQGNHMPWISQAEYTPGQDIIVDIVITAPHRGFFVVRGCADGNASTQECFNQNTLEFVEDVKYGMPKDENYPGRAYMKEGGMKDFRIVYKLPEGLVGKEVLLQWVYYTGNSCNMKGTKDYFNAHPEVGAAANLGLAECGKDEYEMALAPIKGGGSPPEVFINCMEVSVGEGGSTPITPTGTPPVASPPVASPTASYPPPVSSPVSSPVSTPTGGSGCKAVPQSELSPGRWATTDTECEKCASGYQWWPCDSSYLCDCTGGDSPVQAPVPVQQPPVQAPVQPEPQCFCPCQ